jgi:hypothetical protein
MYQNKSVKEIKEGVKIHSVKNINNVNKRNIVIITGLSQYKDMLSEKLKQMIIDQWKTISSVGIVTVPSYSASKGYPMELTNFFRNLITKAKEKEAPNTLIIPYGITEYLSDIYSNIDKIEDNHSVKHMANFFKLTNYYNIYCINIVCENIIDKDFVKYHVEKKFINFLKIIGMTIYTVHTASSSGFFLSYLVERHPDLNLFVLLKGRKINK